MASSKSVRKINAKTSNGVSQSIIDQINSCKGVVKEMALAA